MRECALCMVCGVYGGVCVCVSAQRYWGERKAHQSYLACSEALALRVSLVPLRTTGGAPAAPPVSCSSPLNVLQPSLVSGSPLALTSHPLALVHLHPLSMVLTIPASFDNL